MVLFFCIPRLSGLDIEPVLERTEKSPLLHQRCTSSPPIGA